MRYMGIDYGAKKVGISLSDEEGTMAFPHAVLPNTSRLIEEVAALIKERDVSAVVIGESRDLSGKENPIAVQARAFARTLEERTGTSVHFEPELYTTQEARQMPDGERTKAGKDVDASAAALILTSFFERTKPHLPPADEPELY